MVTYLIAEVMYFPLHIYAGVHCLPHRLPAHASFIPVFIMHVPDVPNSRAKARIHISLPLSKPARRKWPRGTDYSLQQTQALPTFH